MTERSKGELAFIDQMTRKLLVDWGAHQIQNGPLPDFESLTTGDLEKFARTSDKGIHPTLAAARELGLCGIYLGHAIAKGWISKKTPRTLTSKGWGTAAAFLKR